MAKDCLECEHSRGAWNEEPCLACLREKRYLVEEEEKGMGYVVCPNCRHKWYLYTGDLK